MPLDNSSMRGGITSGAFHIAVVVKVQAVINKWVLVLLKNDGMILEVICGQGIPSACRFVKLVRDAIDIGDLDSEVMLGLLVTYHQVSCSRGQGRPSARESCQARARCAESQ